MANFSPKAKLRVALTLPSGNLAAEPHRFANALGTTRSTATVTLPFPEKFCWSIDFWRQAFVHRTIEGRLLQHFAVLRIGRKWNVNFRRQRNDPAGRVLGHFLFN